METPKYKHNVTLDSECADCVEIKTDNSTVVINQAKKIAELEQENEIMEKQVEIITTTTSNMNDAIYSLEQEVKSLKHQIAVLREFM